MSCGTIRAREAKLVVGAAEIVRARRVVVSCISARDVIKAHIVAIAQVSNHLDAQEKICIIRPVRLANSITIIDLIAQPPGSAIRGPPTILNIVAFGIVHDAVRAAVARRQSIGRLVDARDRLKVGGWRRAQLVGDKVEHAGPVPGTSRHDHHQTEGSASVGLHRVDLIYRGTVLTRIHGVGCPPVSCHVTIYSHVERGQGDVVPSSQSGRVLGHNVTAARSSGCRRKGAGAQLRRPSKAEGPVRAGHTSARARST